MKYISPCHIISQSSQCVQNVLIVSRPSHWPLLCAERSPGIMHYAGRKRLTIFFVHQFRAFILSCEQSHFIPIENGQLSIKKQECMNVLSLNDKRRQKNIHSYTCSYTPLTLFISIFFDIFTLCYHFCCNKYMFIDTEIYRPERIKLIPVKLKKKNLFYFVFVILFAKALFLLTWIFICLYKCCHYIDIKTNHSINLLKVVLMWLKMVIDHYK